MPRKLLIALLTFGTVAGFGSGFASLAHHLHGGWRCHHGYDGSPSSRWKELHGFDDEGARGFAAPANPGPVMQSPAPVAAPLVQASPQLQPVQQVQAVQPVQPQLQPIVIMPPPTLAPAAPATAPSAPVSIQLTINPNGQVQVAPTSPTPSGK